MKGLIIWAYAECRSVMATYRELMASAGCPCLLVLLRGERGRDCNLRVQVGFRGDEFASVPREYVGLDFKKGLQIIEAHPHWNHIFSDYQGNQIVRRLIVAAKSRGCHIGVINEAPCNLSSGLRWLAKELYMRYILPLRLRTVIKCADFFANCSGDDLRALRPLRWPCDKIISFGYYPPPIEGSKCLKRKANGRFTILSSGVLSKYRGGDCLIRALKILKDWGVGYDAVITQGGELLPKLKKYAQRYALPVSFVGFVSLPDLVNLYETCSVYVGSGRDEPWGMRLNDVLNCGAPLVISSGMGGRKLVDDYGCGYVFSRKDPVSLAYWLRELSCDDVKYNRCAERSVAAAHSISPAKQAESLWEKIRKFEGWC